MNVKVKKLREDAIIPKYQTPGSAGFDVHAVIDEEIPMLMPIGQGVETPLEERYKTMRGTWINGKTQKIIGTGLAFSLPQGTELQIRPRSGLAAKNGITITNSPGTLDESYTGELKIILCNLSDTPFFIEHGDRIAQCVLGRYEVAEFNEVDTLGETQRGAGGFGSTGNK